MAKGGAGAGAQFTGLADMFNGGGAGAAGDMFKGHNAFTRAMAELGNGLKGLQPQSGQTPPFNPVGSQPPQPMALPPRPAMPQMPQSMQYSGRGDVGMPQPMASGPAQGPSMPYPGAEVSDDYLSRLRQRANQGDAMAMDMLRRYEQGAL